MTKNTDLHTHSYYSDGLLSPKQLVRLAKKKGIKNLALTDHDSIRGVKEAVQEAKKLKINIIPAVEIRCDKGEILGYFIDINNRKLKKEITESSKKNQKTVKDFCKRLNKKDYNITFKELWDKYPKARGNINQFYPFYELYLKGYGKSFKELTGKLKKQKLERIKHKRFPVIEAIKIIKNAKGVPVLAHPWLDTKALKEKNLKKYIKAGLRGIEINNGDNYPFKKKGTNEKIRKLAKKYILILTSGSDYHGEKALRLFPGNHNLGKNNCDEEIVEKLKELSKS